MAEGFFLFVQFEFGWELGLPDGRYLLRERAGDEPKRVVVLGTLRSGASSRARGLGRRGLRPVAPDEQEPALAPALTRATLVDPVPVSAEAQARAWLSTLDLEHEAQAAARLLNQVLQYHRIAAADPYVHEVSPEQALTIRAGWGEGEQVADGRWRHALELPRPAPGPARRPLRRRRARAAALRPQERLAELLGARTRELVCEELALRARLDLEHGRVRLAAIETDGAYAAALSELGAEERQDLRVRVAELEQLRAGVAERARAAVASSAEEHAPPDQQELMEHALARLEAALRARAAASRLR